MRKYIALTVALLLLFLSTAGCIDIYLVKDLLVPQKKEEISYRINNYHVGNYTFRSEPNPDNYIDDYSGEFGHTIQPLTKSMRFDIDVTMRSAEGIINESWPDPLPGWVKDLLEQLLTLASQRYVEITITSPEGIELYNERFNETAEDEIFLSGPADGEWIVEAEGAGVGFDEIYGFEYHDMFSIDLIANEPTY